MTRTSSRSLIPGFLSVGGLGFALDATVFQTLYSLGQGHVSARLLSATLAITLTWYLNRHFVFKTGTANNSGQEYVRYVAVQTLGLIVNLLVYFGLVEWFSLFRTLPILALCGGATAALTFNFVGARYYAFKTQ